MEKLKNNKIQAFLSIILVNENELKTIKKDLILISQNISNIVDDYEIIIIHNPTNKNFGQDIQKVIDELKINNLQIIVLTDKVDYDTAIWAGIENSIGDYVAVFNPLTDEIKLIKKMLKYCLDGFDIIFSKNKNKVRHNLTYKILSKIFNFSFKFSTGVDLLKDAPPYRLFSKSVVSYLMYNRNPTIAYKYLPVKSGFKKKYLIFSKDIKKRKYNKSLIDNIDRGFKIITNSTKVPLRFVTFLTFFGAISNIFYSIYILVVAIFFENVAEGWVSLSLQQSGMFFLVSVVLLVLSEYILSILNTSYKDSDYHVADEYKSSFISKRAKLNVEFKKVK